MKTINANDLRRRIDAGPVAIFDVRGDVDYEYGHIPSAKTSPLGSLVFRVVSNMNPGSFLVVYSGADDGLAAQAAERLTDLGMSNVHVLEGGIEAWGDAGGEVLESPSAKVQARGPVEEVRQIVVDMDRAYGGAFKETEAQDIGGAGG